MSCGSNTTGYCIERTYCDWVERFIRFHGLRHPREMAEAEVGEFLTSLAPDGHVAASTQNQALSALLFLYKHVLSRRTARFPRFIPPASVL